MLMCIWIAKRKVMYAAFFKHSLTIETSYFLGQFFRNDSSASNQQEIVRGIRVVAGEPMQWQEEW